MPKRKVKRRNAPGQPREVRNPVLTERKFGRGVAYAQFELLAAESGGSRAEIDAARKNLLESISFAKTGGLKTGRF